MNWWIMSQRRCAYNSKLYSTLSSLSFCGYLIISISTFASLLDIPIGITSPAIRLKICAITAEIRNPIIKEMKEKHN